MWFAQNITLSVEGEHASRTFDLIIDAGKFSECIANSGENPLLDEIRIRDAGRML